MFTHPAAAAAAAAAYTENNLGCAGRKHDNTSTAAADWLIAIYRGRSSFDGPPPSDLRERPPGENASLIFLGEVKTDNLRTS